MRYAAVLKFNREQSLHAMWQTTFICSDDSATTDEFAASYVNGSSTLNTLQSVSENYSASTANFQVQMVAVKAASVGGGSTVSTNYSYTGTGYAKPHIHNADARFLDRHVESSKMGHAALLLLMLEAASADLVSPSA
jgi:hypothetical protein